MIVMKENSDPLADQPGRDRIAGSCSTANLGGHRRVRRQCHRRQRAQRAQMTPFLGQLLAQHDVVLALDHLAHSALIYSSMLAKSREPRSAQRQRDAELVRRGVVESSLDSKPSSNFAFANRLMPVRV